MKKFIYVAWFMLFILLFESNPVASAKQKVDAPTASIAQGSYYLEQNVELSSTTPGVSIYFTLDGSTPTTSSDLYKEPIRIQSDTTIKAVAIKGKVSSPVLEKSKGNISSEVVSFDYKFETRESLASKFLSFTYNSMPYRLYVPEGYDPRKAYPLVLYLHGSGGRGNDNLKQLMTNDGAVIWASPEIQSKEQLFVLAPQGREEWDGGFGLTRDQHNNINLNRVFEVSTDLYISYEVLQQVRENYTIDEDRLYSVGVSQGGFGTFNLNMMYPDLFAAMVAIAGGGDREQSHLLVDKPMWIFHAEDDQVIPVSYSRNIVEELRRLGGNPIYTEYLANEKYNHASWVPAFKNIELMNWLLKQSKNKS